MYKWILRRLGCTTPQGWLTSLCTVGIAGQTHVCAARHLANGSVSLRLSWALHVASQYAEDDELRTEAVASVLFIYVEEGASPVIPEDDLLQIVFHGCHSSQLRTDADDGGIEAFLQRVRSTMCDWHPTRRQCADHIVRQMLSRFAQ